MFHSQRLFLTILLSSVTVTLVGCSANGKAGPTSSIGAAPVATVATGPSSSRAAPLPSDLSSTVVSTQQPAIPQGPPLDSAVAVLLGFSYDEITKAVQSKHRAEIAKCLVASGWKISEAVMAGFETSAQPTDTLAGAIASIENPIVVASEWKIPEFQSAAASCDQEVKAKFPSPLSRLSEISKNFDSEITGRVKVSTEMSVAEGAYERCLSGIGLNRGALLNSSNSIAQGIDETLSAFRNGKINKATALSKLRGLLDEDSTLQASKGCTDEYNRAVLEVVSFEQASYIKQNPGFPVSVAENLRSAVGQYSDFLRK